MPATLIAGDQTTGNINASQIPPDMDNVLHQLEPNVAPLTVLTQKLKKRKAMAPKVEWLEHGRMPRFTSLSASATSAATAFGVTDNIFRVGDLLRITETGEAVQVTTTAAGAITATRAIGAVSAALSATSAAQLFIVGNVNAEGASIREIKTRKLDALFNYCEINRNPTGLTGTDAATKQFTGYSRSNLQAEAGVEHMRDWEGIGLFGAKSITNPTTTPVRTAGGLEEFVTTNITNVNGALSEASFQTFLQNGFRYGGSRKLLLCSPIALGAIEGYARGNIKTSGSSDHADTYGIQMSTYVSGAGTVDIVQERWFADSLNYKGRMYLIDLDNVFFAELRESKLLEGRQANDADKLEDEWLGEGCFVYANELTHAIGKGITG